MSKKRVLAGIMSLLLLITSVFTGNVVTARAEELVIDSGNYDGEGLYVVAADATLTSFQSVRIPDGCCFIVETAISVSGAITVEPGGRLEVLDGGRITCGSFSVGERVDGKDPSIFFDGTSNVPVIGGSALELYEPTDSGVSKIQDFQYFEFIYDYTEGKWIWFNPYDAFGPDESYPTIVEVALLGYDRGEEAFPISFDGVDNGNTFDGWDRMKARVNTSSLTISWDPNAGVQPKQICVQGAGENGDWLIHDVTGEETSYTIGLNRMKDEDTPEDYYYVEVKYQLDQGEGGGVTSYGQNGRLEFNIENPDKGDVFFQIGEEGPKYRVGGTEEVPETAIQNALSGTTFNANDKIKVWAGACGGKIVGNFDIRIDGTSVFVDDDAKTAARTATENESGYTFIVPENYNGQDRIEFAIEFRDETPGGGGGVNSYGKNNMLAFNITNSDKGDVFFQIGEEKYRVGGDDQYSESTIIDTLKDKEFAETETITVWAVNGEGVNVSHFDILINGVSAFDDTTRDEAKDAAQGANGYRFTVPSGYTPDKLIEFQIEFRDDTSGGGGENDVTYTESTTISEDTTKNDITVSAGTLTIDNCSVRVDHKLVVESGATIVGTTASSKLVFASGAFSNGIALYYQDDKISGDNNNYYSNNGDGPAEFIWDTASNRWVTNQQPAEEGGGNFPWYTVSYGNSANLTTENGQVYAERVHIGDITYSSIASEYNDSEEDKIFSMEDTIFHQKTQEEENDPNYVDSLTRYGIGGSDGDIFIRSDVSGVSIDFKFIPDFGYQLTNIYTNENETESLLSDFAAAEAVSSFKFEAIQGKNVHFEVKFEKVDNTITGNAGIASSAKIESTNAATSGTLKMTVDDATASNDIPFGSEALAAYDITLANIVSKGGDRGSWDTPLEDLGGNVATVTLPVENADTTNYTYTVIREHGGEQPATLDATVTNGTITFDTNKFSTYTIVKKPIIRSIENAEITLGDALTYNGAEQTQTIASVKVDGRTLTAGTDYEITGNTGTDAGTYTLTINGIGNYNGTKNKSWSIGQKSIAGATVTLGTDLTYDGTTQTQTVSSVAIGESTLTANTDYTITENQQKDAGTYTLKVEGTGNYTGTATKEFTISKAPLTPALGGTTTKVYDNTTTVTATNTLTLTVNGLKNSETVTVTATGYAYDDANVGTGKTITATGITISGDAAKNYELSETTATVTGGEITQATPTITLSNLSETTQAPTGAKATLNPADASATVVVQYKVVDTPAVAATPGVPCNVTHEEGCASLTGGNTIANCDCAKAHTSHDEECGFKAAVPAQDATYKWVTTRPTTPGEYKVRAYLPTGTTNVAAIPESSAVTGTYTLTQYTAPAGDNTSNNTGSSSSSGSTTTTPTTPATTTPEAPAATDTTTAKPATKKPATQTEETTAGKTIGVVSEDGSSGWTDIENEISDKLEAALEAAGEDGETETAEVVVEMNGEKKIPTDIFEAIKGQNIVVSFEMGDGIVWTVNGMDVTADKFDNISFGASTGSGVTAIPTELIAGIAGENIGIELTLEYEGEFGFTAVMSVNVDKKNAGKYANLFYFNPKTETMEFICSAPVKEDGTTDLTFTHASDYVIVVSDATMSATDNTSMEDVQGAESGDTSDEPATGEVTTDKKAWTPIWIIVIGAFVIIIGGIVLFAVKKKND